jgi:bacterial/archaeal transporter family-2 protein
MSRYLWILIAFVAGGFYVTAVVLAFPRLGPALTFGLVVAGQMIISLALDHFNILVSQPHPLTLWRVVGMTLVIAGVIIIRKF